jgi:queuosine precursor transporter
MNKRLLGLLALAGYLSTIVFANWLITRYGAVPVGFGLVAPAGVYAAGLAFGLRDAVQELLGRWWVLPAIVAGAALSFATGAGRIARLGQPTGLDV